MTAPDCAALTFDCYGTLIDWESGIRAVLGSGEAVLERYAALETAAEAGPYKSYREVLAGIGRAFGAPPSALADSLEDWEPFPDTVAALKALKKRFRLGVISNVDDDLFAATARKLEVSFDVVVTAQRVRAYKPSRKPFETALSALGLAPERVLHCAQSLFHDVAPASALGFKTAWVNRRKGKAGWGATPASSAKADLEFSSLESLAADLLSFPL